MTDIKIPTLENKFTITINGYRSNTNRHILKNQSRIKQISNAITKKIKESQKPAAHQRKKSENSKKGKYTP